MQQLAVASPAAVKLCPLVEVFSPPLLNVITCLKVCLSYHYEPLSSIKMNYRLLSNISIIPNIAHY